MQSKVDSFCEATTNTAIGFLISLTVWQILAWAYGIPMPILENLQITGIFTVTSILRQYILRRMFDGRTVWQAIKDRWI